jgi:caspase domain-containing protein
MIESALIEAKVENAMAEARFPRRAVRGVPFERRGLATLCRLLRWTLAFVLGAMLPAAPLAQAQPLPRAAAAAPPTRSLPRAAVKDDHPSAGDPTSTRERGLLAGQPSAAAPPAPASVKLRHALVIGNAAYPTSPLRNPRNDAEDVAAKLEQLQWSVSLVLDASEQRMRAALTELGRQLLDGHDALLYYSGHGVQIDGVNYLVPLDTPFTTRLDIKNHAISLNAVMETFTERDGGVNVVILDACRDNPLPATERTIARGLAAVDATRASNTWIAYATKPNSVSSDGAGRNGTYTGQLLRFIGLDAPVYEMFMHVRNAVLDETGNRQEPWDEGSLREAFRIVPYDEPLAVTRGDSGKYVIRERSTARTHELRTSVSPSEVRALALLSYHRNASDWWGGLERSAAKLGEAVALQAKLETALVQMQAEPGCAADRLRLSQTRLKVMDHRANINAEAMLEALEPALARAPRQSCDVGRFPWRDAALAAIGSAVLGTAIAGTVYYTSARASWADARQSCPGGECPGDDNAGPRQSRAAKADADRATWLFSIGAVALAGMAATYFLWPEPRPASPEHAGNHRVQLGVSSQGPWASATVAF